MTINKEIVNRLWNFNDRIQTPLSECLSLGFLEEDAKLLSDIGLPEWVAPNIWFPKPIEYSSKFILMGQNGDKDKIVYEKNSGNVLVLKNSEASVLLACNVDSLILILICFAEMVEKAFELDSNSIIKNRISAEFIDQFEFYAKHLFELEAYKKSFWKPYIQRLRMSPSLDSNSKDSGNEF